MIGFRLSAHARGMSVILVVFASAPAVADARPVRVLMFNTMPNTAYDVSVSGKLYGTVASSGTGSLDFAGDVASGDIVGFAAANLQAPAPPLFLSFESDDGDCAHAAWAPSSDPTVTGYVVYLGTRSVAGGQAASYDAFYPVTGAASYVACSLAPGTYYAAVRARNYAGVLSPYSTERSLSITTVAVLISSFDASLQDNDIRLAWDVQTDEEIAGYQIYRNENQEPDVVAVVVDSLPQTTREFVDTSVQSATTYEYGLGAARADGSEARSLPVSITTPALELRLLPNAPNPFNPTTRIPFVLDHAGRVTIRVYNVRGALFATLRDEDMPEGRHEINWDGRDDTGRPAASGVYICTLTLDGRTLSHKMTLLK